MSLLFTIDIARPLFDYFLGRPAPTVMPLPGGGPIILGLFLLIGPFLFLRCICRPGALLRCLSGPLRVIPSCMMPLPALVPAAAIISLAAAFPGWLGGLPGLRGLL
jgi:hypothetical protein